jgi:hypothetical protein
MDIDPDDTAGLDAGANDDSDDDSYGLNPTQQKRWKRQQQQERQSTLAEDEARDNATPPNLHPDDPKNFLKLSSAIKILVARTITEADLTQSDQLMREYCWELVEVIAGSVRLYFLLTSHQALWPRGDTSQSPLRNAHVPLRPQLWAAARVLDVSFREAEQSLEELQDP